MPHPQNFALLSVLLNPGGGPEAWNALLPDWHPKWERDVSWRESLIGDSLCYPLPNGRVEVAVTSWWFEPHLEFWFRIEDPGYTCETVSRRRADGTIEVELVITNGRQTPTIKIPMSWSEGDPVPPLYMYEEDWD